MKVKNNENIKTLKKIKIKEKQKENREILKTNDFEEDSIEVSVSANSDEDFGTPIKKKKYKTKNNKLDASIQNVDGGETRKESPKKRGRKKKLETYVIT